MLNVHVLQCMYGQPFSVEGFMIKICQNYINHIQFKYMTLSYLQTRVPLRKGGPLSLVRDNIKHIYAYVCFIKKSVTADMLLIYMTHIVLSGKHTCKCVTEYTINNHPWVVSTATFSSPSRFSMYLYLFLWTPLLLMILCVYLFYHCP